MLLPYLGLFLLGVAALYGGGELLVRGSASLAKSFGIRTFIVGLTVVAFATSAPELVVSGLASLRGTSDIALGNLVGSNIANIALVLGLCALVQPLTVEMSTLRREMPFMLGASFLVWVCGAFGGSVSRGEGALLLVCFSAFMLISLLTAREKNGEKAANRPPARTGRHLLLILIGLLFLVAGANAVVESAIWIAEQLGVSKLVISLTMVAVGTSLPEIAASVVGVIKGEEDIAVGNVIGSNIFNILLVMGICAAINPIEVRADTVLQDAPVMVGVALLSLALMGGRLKISRAGGGLLLLVYAAYIALLARRAVVATG